MEYFIPNQTSVTKLSAYCYATGIIITTFLKILLGHNNVLALTHLGMKVRVSCCSLIYRKSLTLSKRALVDTTVGQMINLLSNDVNRFDMGAVCFPDLVVAPVQLAITVYLLYTTLGPTAITGIAAFLLFIPVQCK